MVRPSVRLSHRVKRFEATAEHAAHEQQKLKEYPLLIASLRREMEKVPILPLDLPLLCFPRRGPYNGATKHAGHYPHR